MNKLHDEPVVIINAVTVLVEASIAAAVGFGLDWTPEQVGLAMGVVVALGGLVQTWLTRARVTPWSAQEKYPA